MQKLQEKPRLLVAMPVHNEQDTLNAVIDSVLAYVDDVVIIDDGSTDGSKDILAQRQDICVVTHEKNRGYGQSIIDAIQFAVGCDFDWLLTMDCDLQHDAAQLPDFIQAIHEDNADIISGSRYLAASEVSGTAPSDRRRINRDITAMLNRDLKLGVTDSFCGYKALRVKAMQQLNLTEKGYALPLEFWVQAAAAGLRIREIPVNRIYIDADRSFGGNLDEATIRLAHYLTVYHKARRRVEVGGCEPCLNCQVSV